MTLMVAASVAARAARSRPARRLTTREDAMDNAALVVLGGLHHLRLLLTPPRCHASRRRHRRPCCLHPVRHLEHRIFRFPLFGLQGTEWSSN